MSLEEINKIVVFLFTVTNLAALGLELKPRETVKALQNPVFVILILFWGWVIGPGLALLITKIIPLSVPHSAGLVLISLAPMTPAYPIMVSKARGDMSAAGAFTLVAAVATVMLLPVMVPWLVKGLEVSIWALAKPLLTLVLLPLAFGVAIRLGAAKFADQILPAIKKAGGLFMILCAVLTTWVYWKEMVATIGSFAIGAIVLFLVVLTAISYIVGLGLSQKQRSAMSLGMCTRNISAVFVAYFAITNPDPGILVMIVLLIPLTIIVGFLAARVFASQAGKFEVEEKVTL